MIEIVIYSSSRCGACGDVIPYVKELARGKAKVKVVDVDECHTKACNEVRYTPKIMLDSREIRGLEELKRVLESG